MAKKIQLQDASGNVLHPLTLGECVAMDNGENLDTLMSKSQMFTPTIVQDKSMFKVGTGVDVDYSANVKDGAYESLVFKGKSLVNVIKNYTRSGYGSLSGSIALLDSGWIRATATSSNNHFELKMDNLNIKPSTKYMYILECRSNTFSGNGQTFQFGDTYKSHVDTPWTAPHIVRELPLGRYTFILTTKSDFSTLNNPVGDRSYICVGNGQIEFRYMILEYQEGMENWDIPFFTGLCDSKMPILRNVGKNLINKATNTDGRFIWTTGGEYSDTNTIRTDFIRVPSNSTLYSNYKAHFFLYDRNKQYLGVNEVGNKTSSAGSMKNTHVIGTNETYVRIYWDKTSGEDNHLTVCSTATTYEDYKTNILRTSEEIVLREVDGVCDTYNSLTGEYIRRIGEIVVDGETLVGTPAIYENTVRFAHPHTQMVEKAKPGALAIANNMIFMKDNNEDIPHFRFDYSTYGSPTFWVDKSKLETVDSNGVRKYLTQNPVTIQYELAEPVATIVKPSTMTPFAYQNGHVIVESGFEGQSLLPEIEYSVVTGRTGQVTQNTKVLRKQEQQIISLEELLLTQVVQMEYERTLLQFDYELQMMMLG